MNEAGLLLIIKNGFEMSIQVGNIQGGERKKNARTVNHFSKEMTNEFHCYLINLKILIGKIDCYDTLLGHFQSDVVYQCSLIERDRIFIDMNCM